MIGIIKIVNLKVHCVLGAYAYERNQEQELGIDVDAYTDFSLPALNDALTDTVNYEKIASLCRDLAIKRKYHLIETFAFELVHALLNEFSSLEKVRVRIKKRKALPLADETVVELEKNREEMG